MFEVGGKLFRGKVNVLNNRRGRVFHDVTDIKEDTRGLMDQYGKPQAQFPDVSTPASITQPGSEGKGGGDFTTRSSRSVTLPPSGKDEKILDKKRSKDEVFEEKFIDSRAPVRNFQKDVGDVKEVFDPKTGYTVLVLSLKGGGNGKIGRKGDVGANSCRYRIA